MKSGRQTEILQIISERDIETQHQLLQGEDLSLVSSGIDRRAERRGEHCKEREYPAEHPTRGSSYLFCPGFHMPSPVAYNPTDSFHRIVSLSVG